MTEAGTASVNWSNGSGAPEGRDGVESRGWKTASREMSPITSRARGPRPGSYSPSVEK